MWDFFIFLPLSKGVLQGIIVGHVLFTIYINNITSSMTNCNAHLYADDTVLYYCAKTAHEAITILQQAFCKLQDSLFNLKFVLDANKTKFMIFSRARDIADIGLQCYYSNRTQYWNSFWLQIFVLDQKFKFRINTLVSKLWQQMGFNAETELLSPCSVGKMSVFVITFFHLFCQCVCMTLKKTKLLG